MSALGVVASIASARAEDAGRRDFLATLVAEEPQVETEIAPQAAAFGDEQARRYDFSSDLAVQITKPLGVVINPNYTVLRPGGSGFQALEVGVKYQFVADAEHEFILSAAVLSALGGVGSRSVDADTYTAMIPTLYYGKGAGDLPDILAWARPLALTGQVGFAVPTRSRSPRSETGGGSPTANPYVLALEGSLQYSFPYLTRHLLSDPLPKFLSALAPLVEYDLDIPVANAARSSGTIVGTINPGFLWVDDERSITYGVEALIPINRASGTHPGVRLQLSYSFKPPWPLGGSAQD